MMRVLPYLAFISIVLGAKIILIAYFGNATPYWDQWDAEADLLYKPFLEGTLDWKSLFAAHNEHRILTTRLIGLSLLILNNNIWNPLLQMFVNAGIHILALTTLLYFLTQSISKKFIFSLFVFAAILFAIPYGHENTLAGFQTQFYLLLLFSFIFLWAISRYEPLSALWWFGLLCGLLSCLSLASGALTLAAGLGLIVVRWVMNVRRDKITAIFFVILLVGFLFSVWMTPTVSAHAELKAQSFMAYISAIFKVISWPAKRPWGLLLYIPLVVFLFVQLKRKPKYHDTSWFIFALGLWVIGQILSVAYGRAPGVSSSRYLDLFALGVIVNFFCLLQLIEQWNQYRFFSFIWIIVIFLGLGFTTFQIGTQLQEKRYNSLQQEKNVRNYLATKKISHLENKPSQHIPYPSAQRLKNLLDSKAIQAILPSHLKDSKNLSVQNKSDSLRLEILFGTLLIAFGVGLFFALNAQQSFRLKNKGDKYER